MFNNLSIFNVLMFNFGRGELEKQGGNVDFNLLSGERLCFTK